jgi:glycosyltransferase involved in cell wall biosynthesis
LTGVWLHVLVPAYGQSPFLAETLRSWQSELESGLEGVEVSVVDDASPSTEVADVAGRFPEFEYVRNGENRGPAANFQHCIEMSRGTYTVLCGSDDIALRGYAAGLRELVQRFPDAAMAMPGVKVIDEFGLAAAGTADRVKRGLTPRTVEMIELPGRRLATSLLLGNWLYFPAIVWRTDVLRRHGFRTDLQTVMDLDLELRLAFEGETLAYRPEKLFGYRRHTSSFSSRTAESGERFDEEAEVSAWAAKRAKELGWRSAALAARARPTSRAHQLLRRFTR